MTGFIRLKRRERKLVSAPLQGFCMFCHLLPVQNCLCCEINFGDTALFPSNNQDFPLKAFILNMCGNLIQFGSFLYKRVALLGV